MRRVVQIRVFAEDGILAEHAPRITFGLPVRNEAGAISRCLDSILSQTYSDFEVIVSDNASTDSTRRTVADYAARDSRIRLYTQDQNLGVIENFNHCARLARGEFFRWIGADDWIEPSYASECLRALESQPEAIAATTGFDLERARDEYECLEYEGELLESLDPVHRLERLIWLLEKGPGVYEPVYCLVRRRQLIATGLLRLHRKNDWLFAAQLCLAGPFVHVEERLFHRWWPSSQERNKDLAQKLHPVRHRELGVSSRKLLTGLFDVVAQAELSETEQRACRRLVGRYCARQLGRGVIKSINRFRRERLGLTRESILGFRG